jgi:hypothetical protein
MNEVARTAPSSAIRGYLKRAIRSRASAIASVQIAEAEIAGLTGRRVAAGGPIVPSGGGVLPQASTGGAAVGSTMPLMASDVRRLRGAVEMDDPSFGALARRLAVPYRSDPVRYGEFRGQLRSVIDRRRQWRRRIVPCARLGIAAAPGAMCDRFEGAVLGVSASPMPMGSVGSRRGRRRGRRRRIRRGSASTSRRRRS